MPAKKKAKVSSAIVAKACQVLAFAEQPALAEPLAARRRYTFAEYETIRLADEEADRQVVSGENGHAPGTVAFLGVDNERRVYQA